MAEIVSLLPEITAPREAAVEATSAPRWDLPVDLIKAVGRADECPPDLIGYLAWARSVDLWRADWPIELKRHVTGRAFLDHRLKGTLDLHARYLGYVGAKILRAITPPARFVLGARRSEAETEALLGAMPELRIWRQASPRRPGRRTVWGHFAWSGRKGWSAEHALDHHETRAVMIADGVVTRLRVAEIEAGLVDDLGVFARLHIPHAWGGARVLGAGHGRRQRRWGASITTTWVVSYTGDGTHRRTVARGLYPAAAAPETVMGRHAVPPSKAWHGLRRGGRRFFLASVAAGHVYDRLRLWDRAAATHHRGKRSYWSWSWRGQPTHSAVLSIAVAARAPGRKRWWGRAFSGAMHPHDGAPLAAALEAVAAARLPHETILVDLDTAFERRFYGA